jgi:hypothetical protein
MEEEGREGRKKSEEGEKGGREKEGGRKKEGGSVGLTRRTERAVRLEEDAELLAVLLQLVLGAVRVQLDLVHRRDDLPGLLEMLEVRDRPVGHPDSLDFSALVDLLHLAPGLALVPFPVDGPGAVGVDGEESVRVVGDQSNGPVDELDSSLLSETTSSRTPAVVVFDADAKSDGGTHVEVKVIRSERLERLPEPVRHIRLMRVPHFTGDEDVLPGDSAVLDPLPDLVLVLVDQRAVEVSVPDLERVRDSVAHLPGLGLPCAESDRGDLDAVVQREVGWDGLGHCAKVSADRWDGDEWCGCCLELSSRS